MVSRKISLARCLIGQLPVAEQREIDSAKRRLRGRDEFAMAACIGEVDVEGRSGSGAAHEQILTEGSESRLITARKEKGGAALSIATGDGFRDRRVGAYKEYVHARLQGLKSGDRRDATGLGSI